MLCYAMLCYVVLDSVECVYEYVREKNQTEMCKYLSPLRRETEKA